MVVKSNEKNITITFIFPNGDEIYAAATYGDTLFDVATDSGIEMNTDYPKSCIVQIDDNEDPRDEDIKDFGADKAQKGYRYAHKVVITKNISAFLKLVRIRYVNQKNNESLMYAYEGENMHDLHERTSTIDLPFACGGNLACSTCMCNFKVSEDVLQTLGPVSEEEEDYLQFSQGDKDSRLGCQVRFPLETDNILVTHPLAKK